MSVWPFINLLFKAMAVLLSDGSLIIVSCCLEFLGNARYNASSDLCDSAFFKMEKIFPKKSKCSGLTFKDSCNLPLSSLFKPFEVVLIDQHQSPFVYPCFISLHNSIAIPSTAGLHRFGNIHDGLYRIH